MSSVQRSGDRKAGELRPVEFLRGYTRYAEGSVLVTMGNTEVLCNVSVSRGVPKFLKGKKQGWLTAEYAMLPRATHDRNVRDSNRPNANARALEIQRLIARSLRSMVNLHKLPELTFTVDCDVIQADGGTRTASINGAALALLDAIEHCQRNKMLKQSPIVRRVAAVSVGIVNDKALLDFGLRRRFASANGYEYRHGRLHEFHRIARHRRARQFQHAATIADAQPGQRRLYAITANANRSHC